METTTTSTAATTITTTVNNGGLHSIEVNPRHHILNRAFALIYLFAILVLFYNHIIKLLNSTNSFITFSISFSILISDLILAFMWTTIQSFRMRPLTRQQYPEKITKNFSNEINNFPPLDIFICTADPYKEPPINVVNTALSVMAYDYNPIEKISIYVSDDGGSELTLFAFMEAAKFAVYWLPFCRENKIIQRSPDAYFNSNYSQNFETEKIKDLNQQTPTQELIAKDLHDVEWRFKHIFRGQPRRHLLTTGWSAFVSSKKLVAGDSFVFLRGDNGKLRVGVKRLVRQQSSMPSSVMSSQSMHLGVLATASHAVTTQTMFVVYYKPRTTQFIVGVNKYLEALKHEYAVGMRFKMQFEAEGNPARRFMGTIVGIDDLSSQWKNSAWRSLKVRWDEPAAIARPDRVSPWEIEPYVCSIPNVLVPPTAGKNKRHLLHSEIKISEQPSSSNASAVWNPSLRSPQFNTFGINSSTNCALASLTESGWQLPHLNTSGMLVDEPEDGRSAPTWCGFPCVLAPQFGQGTNQPIVIPTDERKCDTKKTCRLFGIDLKSSSISTTEAQLQPQPAGISCVFAERAPPNTVPAGDSDQKSELSVDFKDQMQGHLRLPLKEVQSKQSCSTRSRTKVQMQGVAVGRAVDLTILKGYDELTKELEEMFEIQGELQSRQKWGILFTDDEGDTMLMGDYPWQDFCNVVRKIFICSSQDMKKLTLSRADS